MWGFASICRRTRVTCISSSGIVAKLVADLDRIGNHETPVVLSVLVIEDLAMVLYLPIVIAELGIARESDLGALAATYAIILTVVGALLYQFSDALNPCHPEEAVAPSLAGWFKAVPGRGAVARQFALVSREIDFYRPVRPMSPRCHDSCADKLRSPDGTGD